LRVRPIHLAPMPIDRQTDHQGTPTSPRFRRAAAFLLDLTITISLGQVAMVPLSLLVPPDERVSAGLVIVFGSIIGFAYLGFAPRLWGNTLGKKLFGLRLVSVSTVGEPISTPRLFARLLLAGLWPINAGMAMWSRSRRHLGDRLAKTSVERAPHGPALWLGLGVSVILTVGAVQSASFAMRATMMNAPAWKTAQAHLAQLGAEVSLLPFGYRLLNDSAVFDARLGVGYRRVVLARDGSEWKVRGSEAVETPYDGASFQFDSAR